MKRLVMQDEYGYVYWLDNPVDCGESYKAWYNDSRLIINKNDTRILRIEDI